MALIILQEVPGGKCTGNTQGNPQGEITITTINIQIQNLNPKKT